jgi:hypothetical protein
VNRIKIGDLVALPGPRAGWGEVCGVARVEEQHSAFGRITELPTAFWIWVKARGKRIKLVVDADAKLQIPEERS